MPYHIVADDVTELEKKTYVIMTSAGIKVHDMKANDSQQFKSPEQCHKFTIVVLSLDMVSVYEIIIEIQAFEK